MRYNVQGHVLTIALALTLSTGNIYGGIAHSGNLISQDMQRTLVSALRPQPPQRMMEADPFIPESIRKKLRIILKQIYDGQH